MRKECGEVQVHEPIVIFGENMDQATGETADRPPGRETKEIACS